MCIRDRASEGLIALGIALVILIDLTLVWLPLVLYLVWPGATTRRIKAADGWLRAHGRIVAIAALAVCGVALIIDGIVGLV